MTKELFLEILKDGLSDFPEGELSDILYDYKEHFDVGFASGKSEEEIIEELGEPNNIVDQYRNGYLKKYEENQEDESEDFNNSNTHNTTSNDSTNSNTTTNFNKSNSFIISAIIIILTLILFGPLAAGIALTFLGIFFCLMGGSLALIIATVGILVGKFVTNTVGVFQFPEFMLNFPDSVLVLIFFGSLCLFIFSIISLYYLIKQYLRWLKQLINFTSTKLRGE
ncbi:MAG: DUF1700 domain-containing protein [Clostridium sp.]